jgi:hypothetical protein
LDDQWVRMRSQRGFSIRVNGAGVASLAGGGLRTGSSMRGVPPAYRPIIVVDHDTNREYLFGAVKLTGESVLSFSGVDGKLVTQSGPNISPAYVWLFTDRDIVVVEEAFALPPTDYDYMTISPD